MLRPCTPQNRPPSVLRSEAKGGQVKELWKQSGTKECRGLALSACFTAANDHFFGTTLPGFLLKSPCWPGRAFPLQELVGAV